MAVSELAQRTAKIGMAELVQREEEARDSRYAAAWAAYDGCAPLPFDTSGIDGCDNVRLDYAALIVDKGVSFLSGKGGVTYQIDGPEPEAEDGDDPADAVDPAAEQTREREAARALRALDDAWAEEQRHLDFHQLATNGGICGHAWLRLHEDGRVQILDPGNVTVEWDEDDYAIVNRYLIEWATVSSDDGQAVVRRKRIEPNDPVKPASWEIVDEEWDDDSNEWRELDVTPWPKPYAPILGGQNLPAANTFYGKADLEPAVLSMIAQLESLASDMRRICRLQGHPVPVVIGEEAHRLQTLEVAIGALLAIPNKEAKLSQLAIAELTSSLAFYQELKTALFEAARIPKVALGDTANAGPTTGIALQVEYEPLIEKTETKQLTYGILLRQAAERVLDLCGFTGWRVTLGWPQLLPSDEQTESLTAEGDLRMGIVSKQTIAEKRGYDWETEQQRLADEKAEAGPDDPARLLDQFKQPIPPAPEPEVEPAPAE